MLRANHSSWWLSLAVLGSICPALAQPFPNVAEQTNVSNVPVLDLLPPGGNRDGRLRLRPQDQDTRLGLRRLVE